MRRKRAGRDLVVFGYRAMDTESNGLGFSGEVGPPQGALFALYAHLGTIDDVRHFVTIAL